MFDTLMDIIMDYFTNVLASCYLDRGSSLAIYGRIRVFLDLIKNILICVPKINEVLRVFTDIRVSN